MTVDTSDESLIDQTKPYKIVVELEDYPQNDPVETTGTITFVNPCKVPTLFSSSQQTNPAADKYTGVAIVAQLTPFNITPLTCTVTYTCTNVVRKDSTATQMTCSDFTFDPITSQLSLTANSADYESGKFKPGVFVVTITGTADGSDGPLTQTVDIEFTLADPCDPPASV